MNIGLTFPLPETTTLLRETIWEFARNVIAPQAETIDAGQLTTRALWPQLAELGLLGITADEQYGGASMTYLDHAIVIEALSYASASLGLSYAAHSNLCVNQIQRYGTDEQKSRFLPQLINGKHIGALAISEPNAGSDVLSMTVSAEKQGDTYQLNGSKMWITNGASADIVVVYAKTDKTPGSKGISAFIVETNTPGFSAGQPMDKLGMRGSETCELIFDHCQVPASHLLGEENQGVSVLMSGLDYERVMLAAGPVGIMQACLDVVLPYVHERQQFGRPIGEFQLIQAKLADMHTDLNASRSYLYMAAQACDNNKITRQDAASVILHTAERATQTALQAIQCLGGNGYINDYPTGRLLRDAKLYEIGAGTSEIRRMLIGRELFKHTK